MFLRISIVSASPGRRIRSLFAVVAALSAFMLPAAVASAAAPIDPWLERAFARGDQEFFVVLDTHADVAGVASRLKHTTRVARTTAVRAALMEHAARSQAPLRAWLDARGIAYRSFHIVNALLVRGDARLAAELAARADVLRIEGNPPLRVRLPQPEERRELLQKALAAIEPGIVATNAPTLWGQGITGQGIVVGSQDTGVTWDHPALKNQYLGWNGSVAAHDFHWHDSIHAALVPTTNRCGYNTTAPCDDDSHGTHTVGTAVGSDGTNQIGMAPDARWIACRNMDQGTGAPATYLECFEWFLAPYPVGGTPAQGDPARAPDVTINSWTCPASEGCSWQTLQSAVEAQRAAGIMTVVAAGNSGPACNTINDPPGIYDAAYSVGAYDAATNALAWFSGRGTVTVDGSGRQKPDLTAPGVNVLSSLPVGYGTLSGTSMATPHVAGAVALLWSALPALKDNIAATEAALNAGAVPVPVTDCNTSGTPNADWGFGKLDVAAAVAAARLSVAREGSGSGTIGSQPAGISCGTTCAAVFSSGTPVTLTATPDAGSVFVGWLGACSGTGPCVLSDSAGKSVTAGFAPATLQPLTLDIDGNGQADALTDGLMIERFLFGLPAADIAVGATGPAALTTDPGTLLTRLSNLRPLFDVDGNGRTEALTDGVLLIRYLFGLRDLPLTTDALGAGATRTDPAAIASYIGALLP